MRGVSLGEAIVAIFLILASVMVTVTLFHSGMRYGATSERRLMAATFGRKVMQEIRTWAREPANFRSAWAPYDNVSITDPDYPGAEAIVNCKPTGEEFFTPCSELESMYGVRSKRLSSSVVPVSVVVDWGVPGRELKLVSLIGEPERPMPANPRVVLQRVSGPGGLVPTNDVIGLTAELQDSSGAVIPDVSFEWTLKPVTGNATLEKNAVGRDGTNMQLRHNYVWNPLMSPPGEGPISGEVRVEALCRYRGREIVNAPFSVFLQ